jgi:hypothetical protein
MHTHVRSLQKRLKQRKLKDGEHNEQHKKGNEKRVVYRTMYQKNKRCSYSNTNPIENQRRLFVTFNSTLDICLKFIFIEMLDNCITYTVSWYNTLHQILPVA